MEISFPRSMRIFSSFMLTTSWPSNRISPFVMKPVRSGSNFRILRAMVVFPAPVSPTRPRVSPLSSSRLIPFKAYTSSSSVLYITCKFLISSNFSDIPLLPSL